MKRVLFAAALLASTALTPARAGDVTITVPDSFKQIMANAGVAFERCMGAIAIGSGDKSTCTVVQQLLVQLSNQPEVPVPAPSPSPTPINPPAANTPPATVAPAATPSPTPSEAPKQ